MELSRTVLAVLTACGALAAVGCGDDSSGDVDAPPRIDAEPVPDGTPAPDGAVDGAVETFSGTIAIAEVTVAGVPALGQGLTIDIDFIGGGAVPPVLEEMPASPLGCKVWEYTPAQAADPGLDEGAVALTVTDGEPLLPDCTYVPARGYLCRGANGTGGEIVSLDPTMGLWRYTSPQITNAGEQLGRYLVISGAATAANNGAFPIMSFTAADTIVFLNPTAAAEVLPATATFTALAGAGPIPTVGDPGFIDDTDELTVALTTGGEGDFESFTRAFTTAAGGIGDDYQLDDASRTGIRAIPVDGSAFSLSCEGAGGTCNTAIGSVLTITTTDAPIAGLPAYVMPPPTTKQVRIRCATIGSGTVDVSSAASAFLMTAGATRIQASFLRANLQTAGNSGPVPANTNIVAGHAVAGYTDP
jgi:hypothetical protein